MIDCASIRGNTYPVGSQYCRSIVLRCIGKYFTIILDYLLKTRISYFLYVLLGTFLQEKNDNTE